MPNVRYLHRSFAGGEMSPEMYGRIDDQKFQTGAGKIRNFICRPQGPLENRPGFAFVHATKDHNAKSRLIPFTYSTTQTMVLEFGLSYIRFHTGGNTLLAGSPAAYRVAQTPTISIPTAAAAVTVTIAVPAVFTWIAHALPAAAPIVFTTTGALPTGITADTTYYVLAPTANTFNIAATPGGAAITTTGTQSGTHTGTPVANVTLASHGYTAGQQVTFTTTGTLPTGMTAGTSYYVKNPQTNTFEISVLSGGSSVVSSGTQSGTHTLNRTYQLGDLVSYAGTNYYCQVISAGNLPTNPTYWYPQPVTGEYEIPTPYLTADLFDLHHVQSADILTIVHPLYQPRELRRLSATAWTLVPIVFSSTQPAPSSVTSVTTGLTTVKYTYKYVVTSVASDQISESAASSITSIGSNLYETGCIITISWSAVAGASLYNVYKLQGGIYGYIGQTSGLSIVDDNITPDLGSTPPTYDLTFNSASNYPTAVSYFEQRRAFAGTINEPQKIWMTKSGTESNMSYSLPIKDDDRIAFRVAAREANTIRHIVPLTQLILLTSSAEWRVTSVNSDAITPTTISVRPQSYIGASNVQPSIINNTLVYCAARGGHVRELGYNWQASGFITGDLSMRASHLFDGKTITDMTYVKAPNPLCYFVGSNGILLGLTYIPEQQVGAWHWHDTDGSFESCTSVAEGDEDVLYIVVNRTINGITKRYVERQQTRNFTSLDTSFFVDSGLTYNGNNVTATTVIVTGGTLWNSTEVLTVTSSTPIFAYPATTDVHDAIVLTDASGNKYRLTIQGTSSTTVCTVRTDATLPVSLRSAYLLVWAFARDSVGGLSHLEGKTVSIMGDGAVQPPKIVTAGVVTLPRAASIITVGLPYESDLRTLPLALNVDTGFAQGRYKNINKAWMRVYRSSGIFIGPDANNLVEAKQRSTEIYGTPPSLKSQEIEVLLTPTWADSGAVFVRQSDPLPLTIVGMTLEVSVGG